MANLILVKCICFFFIVFFFFLKKSNRKNMLKKLLLVYKIESNILNCNIVIAFSLQLRRKAVRVKIKMLRRYFSCSSNKWLFFYCKMCLVLRFLEVLKKLQ